MNSRFNKENLYSIFQHLNNAKPIFIRISKMQGRIIIRSESECKEEEEGNKEKNGMKKQGKHWWFFLSSNLYRFRSSTLNLLRGEKNNVFSFFDPIQQITVPLHIQCNLTINNQHIHTLHKHRLCNKFIATLHF